MSKHLVFGIDRTGRRKRCYHDFGQIVGNMSGLYGNYKIDRFGDGIDPKDLFASIPYFDLDQAVVFQQIEILISRQYLEFCFISAVEFFRYKTRKRLNVT